MTTHGFTVTLAGAPAGFPETHADALFEAFDGDVGPALSNGRALLDCAVAGDLLVPTVAPSSGSPRRSGSPWTASRSPPPSSAPRPDHPGGAGRSGPRFRLRLGIEKRSAGDRRVRGHQTRRR